ncbi:MAG: urea ABC transporter permease subunit UrtB [Rhodospirillales bacterium]|nr:urea ABC transporter permease subunit UrtB [Rhodospirillales bacterium]
MTKKFKTFSSIFLILISAFLIALPASVKADDLAAMIDKLAQGGFNDREKIISGLAETGDTRVIPALSALGNGTLFLHQPSNKVVITKEAGSNYILIDPITQATLGEEPAGSFEKIKVNNRLRRAVRDALGGLQLRSKNKADRMAAAEDVFKGKDPDAIPLLDTAIAIETDAGVKKVMIEARATAVLSSTLDEAAKLDAINVLKERSGRDARSILMAFAATAEGKLKTSAEAAAKHIESGLAAWATAQNVWYGLSLGSVLLLAAIGLAITFGVMGVINMAHGEMVMLGAYTTFVVQDVIRSSYPQLFEISLLISIPLAFLVAGAVGIAIERGIIRFLYGRPLETLLATWGISLALQQTIRSIFGPTNQEVGNPLFMSGAFEIGQMTITYNRLYILIFSMVVLFALMLLMKKTPYGLQMRAVTQNRRMAGAMGIRTDWVDALTFGLGSGIAGIAGVALSQIDNVSPNLGQSYIIDSFMVVVFGGVGNLWGTLVGAMTLGVANKFLEPFAGAVLGKIVVLVFIILFIQKKPRGMFALKGRAVEA